MRDFVLVGRQGRLLEVPTEKWFEHLEGVRHGPSERLAFMTPEHHRVRNFAVAQLPRNEGRPLEAQDIAQALGLPPDLVEAVLDDLEKHLFFLVLNATHPAGPARAAREVMWAYPVAAEKTQHRLRFSTGERTFAAGAEDAIATPFVQGRLRNETLEVEVESECAHCGRALLFALDSELKWSFNEVAGSPDLLLFEPDIDWKQFSEPNIIDAYGSNSLFFWSEEHAREFRASRRQVDGIYLTLEQAAYATRIAQSALFGFSGEPANKVYLQEDGGIVVTRRKAL